MPKNYLLLSAVPADPPSFIQASTVNSTAVFLSWLPPMTPYGIVLYYTILVEEDSLVERNISGIVVNAQQLEVFNITVVGLLPYTDYNFSIAAATRVGTGPYDWITIMTPQDCELIK